ncbi:hypothetical protein PRUPE_5G083000 [Prunus persica]|uniref:Large ribosomal subunit protein uL11 C-terminal domain-containing protein n=1 Tax=Prunus persica TaxID=3760 RepID=M5WF01_PRUPE|nr:hypothetical protein PRUPE_5G083000 [Prunus persica]
MSEKLPKKSTGSFFCLFHIPIITQWLVFNPKNQKHFPGTCLSAAILCDNTYNFTVKSPSVSWYLKKGTGVDSGSSRLKHVVASELSVRHLYEIAKVKQSEPYCQY